MTADPIVAQAERIVRLVADDLTLIGPGECLVCYVARMLDEVGCDTTLRFAKWFRDRRAPRGVALERRLGDVGGFCDCEILLNGWWPHPRLWTSRREVDDDGIVMQDDPQPAYPRPACATVRLGSTQPCSNWVRRRQHIIRW